MIGNDLLGIRKSRELPPMIFISTRAAGGNVEAGDQAMLEEEGR